MRYFILTIITVLISINSWALTNISGTHNTEIQTDRNFTRPQVNNDLVAAGGQLVGNGGDIVICRDKETDEITFAKSLDVYEAFVLRGIEENLNPHLGVHENFMLLLRRLAPFTSMTKTLEKWYKDFPSEANFLDDISLIDIPDSHHWVKPDGYCEVEQLVRQLDPQFKEDKRYVFDNELWEALSAPDKAVMLMHEFLYRYFNKEGHKNSIVVRYLNSLLAGDRLAGLNMQEFLFDIFSFLRLAELELGDFTLDLSSKDHWEALKFDENGNLIQGDVIGTSRVGKKIISPNGYKNKLFLSNKNVKFGSGFYIAGGELISTVRAVYIQDQEITVSSSHREIALHHGGAIKSLKVKGRYKLKNRVLKDVCVTGQIEFDPNGYVIAGTESLSCQ